MLPSKNRMQQAGEQQVVLLREQLFGKGSAGNPNRNAAATGILWTESCTKLNPWETIMLVGIYRGIIRNPGFLGGA